MTIKTMSFFANKKGIDESTPFSGSFFNYIIY